MRAEAHAIAPGLSGYGGVRCWPLIVVPTRGLVNRFPKKVSGFRRIGVKGCGRTARRAAPVGQHRPAVDEVTSGRNMDSVGLPLLLLAAIWGAFSPMLKAVEMLNERRDKILDPA